MSNDSNTAVPNYNGKSPLLRPLKNLSGQFFLFQQYSNDLTKFLGQSSGNMPIPTTFYCLNLKLPDIHAHDSDIIEVEDNEEVEVDSTIVPTSETPVEENIGDSTENSILLGDSTQSNSIMDINSLVAAEDGLFCKELMFKGKVDIMGTDRVDGIGYNEIYCHIDNDEKREQFKLYLQNNKEYLYGRKAIIGYNPEVEPNVYQFTDYGKYIGDILQNEYENGNTFFNINFSDETSSEENWDNNYYLGRLLYVLYKNGFITLSADESIYDDEPDVTDYVPDPESSSSTQPQAAETPEEVTEEVTEVSSVGETKAGVLSNKALFDDMKSIDGDVMRGVYRFFKTNSMRIAKLDKVKFSFNAIVICYSFLSNGEIDENTEIPMGIYFTGFDKNPSVETDLGNYANAFTKYYRNTEIYNQGTSYTLRVCTRTLSSQATDTSEVVTNIISASNTGEWVNEYEFLMSKFDETYRTLKEAKNYYAAIDENISANLALFRNNRTNVPYIRQVGEKKFWFVNGVNTLQEIIEATDSASWDNPDDQVLPAFQKVIIKPIQRSGVQITPANQVEAYIGSRVAFNIVVSSGIPRFTVEGEDTHEYVWAGSEIYDPTIGIYINKDDEEENNYTFTFTNVSFGCELIVEAII